VRALLCLKTHQRGARVDVAASGHVLQDDQGQTCLRYQIGSRRQIHRFDSLAASRALGCFGCGKIRGRLKTVVRFVEGRLKVGLLSERFFKLLVAG
jgi:hypothetical protein